MANFAVEEDVLLREDAHHVPHQLGVKGAGRIAGEEPHRGKAEDSPFPTGQYGDRRELGGPRRTGKRLAEEVAGAQFRQDGALAIVLLPQDLGPPRCV